MTVATIKEKITILQQKMDIWPGVNITEESERAEVMALTNAHFEAVETDFAALLDQCRMLSPHDQDVITPCLRELKQFVENKFSVAERELIEMKKKWTWDVIMPRQSGLIINLWQIHRIKL